MLDAKTLRKRIAHGCNPVEIAGYGRESTHKGYLTWLLNTEHWCKAGDAVRSILEKAKNKKEEGKQALIEDVIKNIPEKLETEYEKRCGSGTVDLVVKSTCNGRPFKLPIELKTDGKEGKNQLGRLSDKAEPRIGLVFLLGTSAIRDDIENGDRGIFVPLTVCEILDAWGELKSPQPGLDWMNSLRHEKYRLQHAFRIYNCAKEEECKLTEVGYRDKRNKYFSLLNLVRKEMNPSDWKFCDDGPETESRQTDRCKSSHGNWDLYDGGPQLGPVLNLKNNKNWLPIAINHTLPDNNTKIFWEFNCNFLVLKVQRFGSKAWINSLREKLRAYKNEYLNHADTLDIPRRSPRKNSQYITVGSWRISFCSAKDVANRACKIIEISRPIINEYAKN